MRAFPLLLVLLLGIAPAHAAPRADCGFVPGLGDACARPDGLLDVRASDGTLVGTVHGVDPAPLPGVPLATGARAPLCVTGGDQYIHVIYARAYDDADQYAAKAPTIRSL